VICSCFLPSSKTDRSGAAQAAAAIGDGQSLGLLRRTAAAAMSFKESRTQSDRRRSPAAVCHKSRSSVVTRTLRPGR
jgi:hypothetical protein